MRRQIASKLRRVASALSTAMTFAWLALLLAIAAILLIVVLAVGVLAYFAFGWWGVAVVAVFMLIVCFGKDPPAKPTSRRRKRKGFKHPDPFPWYMQNQNRFHHGPTNHHRGDW